MSDNMDPQVVFCDMCTEEDRKPARKTCMKCEISMCVQHLQIHLTTPVLLQTHPLTEPMALCGTTKCPQHGKLLEYYCLDDMTCVCVSCAIEDQHRLHNMKTFSTAHKELMEKLDAEQQALLVKTDDENVSLEKWEKSEREKLGRCSVRLIEAVTNLRDVSLTSVQSSVSARMVSIKTSKSSIQAAQKEKDSFRFLQMYSQVHQDVEKAKAADLRKGLEPGSDREKLVEEIRQGGEKMMKQADQFWCSLLTLVDPEHHQEFIATGSDLIFDPQTLGPGMSLSRDQRKVFYNSWMGQCSATLLICSIESVPNFQRWVVNLSEDCDWTIGLCDKQSVKNLRDGNVYGLCCKGDQLSFLTTEYDDCSDASMPQTPYRISSQTITYHGKNVNESTPRPETVEVFWNLAASSLSFFSRSGQHQSEEILTIKMSLNNSDLVAFVQLGKESDQTSLQQHWKCLCGNVYYKTINGYSMGRYQYSHHANCSCGAFIGEPYITEVICELQ
ncbi:tripartite motif-containing protein 16-like [Thunnus albacares]|uniref:tripartite motif-containing protein 16-like n=1 Tax=Thunnus albacares TaxID=8236 RepID=UPI001CF61798|nr:tripartite motif-containing protein 16-like [Thunnus albacares]